MARGRIVGGPKVSGVIRGARPAPSSGFQERGARAGARGRARAKGSFSGEDGPYLHNDSSIIISFYFILFYFILFILFS